MVFLALVDTPIFSRPRGHFLVVSRRVFKLQSASIVRVGWDKKRLRKAVVRRRDPLHNRKNMRRLGLGSV